MIKAVRNWLAPPFALFSTALVTSTVALYPWSPPWLHHGSTILALLVIGHGLGRLCLWVGATPGHPSRRLAFTFAVVFTVACTGCLFWNIPALIAGLLGLWWTVARYPWLRLAPRPVPIQRTMSAPDLPPAA